MEFCPKCGAMLVKKTKNLGCPRCNYASKEKSELKTSEKIENKKQINVLNEKDLETRPITTENCTKCKNDKAYFWTIQTRSSDEAETKFFQCTKCGHTRKEYN